MIKINKINDITFVNAAVTDFSDSLGYCEYKIPLSIQGVKPKPSQALIQGTKAHHEKDVYEKEHVELEPVTITEIKDEKKDIEFARENIYSTLTIPFEFPNQNVVVSLFGRIDQYVAEELCRMLLENVSQLILLIHDAQYDSVKTIINNLNPAVSEYRLVTNEKQTKIEKCL